MSVKKGLFKGYSLDEIRQLIAYLKQYEKTAFAKEVTFLDIDVAGATQLKIGEDDFDIQWTFDEYHKLLEGIVKMHKGKIFNRAGDGVVFIFQGKEQADRAVNAAIRTNQALVDFNNKQNRLKSPVVVRIGINSGEVLMDKSIESGRVFSHILDIAGHLQKEAGPCRILIGKETFSRLKEKTLCKEAGYSEKDKVLVYTIDFL